MTRLFFLILGIILTVIGFTYIISYLNLFSLGYNFSEYGKFICSRPECIISIIGLIIILLTIITMKGEKK